MGNFSSVTCQQSDKGKQKGETGRRRRKLAAAGGSTKGPIDPRILVLCEEELASRSTILSEYELEANRISNRHPLSPTSIATYSTEKHLVFIRHGKAYDATGWFETHPGGKFVLLKYAGKDVSDVFDRFHSRRTKNELLKETFIGNVWRGRGHVSASGNSSSNDYSGGGGGRPVSASRGGSRGGAPSSPLVGGYSTEIVPAPLHYQHHHSTGGYSYLGLLGSPTGSDHGDFEGRIVRVKPLTPSGDVIRIWVAFPERLLCDLGGSIVIKHKGTARNYSPCYIEETNFSLVIKRYEKGIVSNYLFSKRIGDCLEFDGPYQPKQTVPDKKYKVLLLIGQGTGVVPILEVARTVIAEVIFFVSCYSNIDDALFSKELSLLPDYVRLVYFIPNCDPVEDATCVPGLLYASRIRCDLIASAMAVSGLPLCGPDGCSVRKGGGVGGGERERTLSSPPGAGSNSATPLSPFSSPPSPQQAQKVGDHSLNTNTNTKDNATDDPETLATCATTAPQLGTGLMAASSSAASRAVAPPSSSSSPSLLSSAKPKRGVIPLRGGGNASSATTPAAAGGGGGSLTEEIAIGLASGDAPAAEGRASNVGACREGTSPLETSSVRSSVRSGNGAVVVAADNNKNKSPRGRTVSGAITPSKCIPASVIDGVMICGSFTFFDDVSRGLVEALGINKEIIMQL